MRLQQGSVLPKSVQRRHERVALLAALALTDLMHGPFRIVEDIGAGLGIELRDKREQPGQAWRPLEAAQHAGPRDVVVGADAVNTASSSVAARPARARDSAPARALPVCFAAL